MIDVKMAMLLDVYGGLLTKKQYDAADLYYNEDYSLNEIANYFNVSIDYLINGEEFKKR